jgi:hypothetical protein
MVAAWADADSLVAQSAVEGLKLGFESFLKEGIR